MKGLGFLFLAFFVFVLASPFAFADSEVMNIQCSYNSSDVSCDDSVVFSCAVVDVTQSTLGISSVRIYVSEDDLVGTPATLVSGTVFNGTWDYNLSGVNGYDSVSLYRLVVSNGLGVVCDAKNNKDSTFCYVRFPADVVDMTCPYTCDRVSTFTFPDDDYYIETVTPGAGCVGEVAYNLTRPYDFCDPEWVPEYACVAENEGRYNTFKDVFASYSRVGGAYEYETRYSYPLNGFADKQFVSNNPSCCEATNLSSDCTPPLGETGVVECRLDYWNAEGKSSDLSRYNDFGGPLDAISEYFTGLSTYLKPVVFDLDEDRFNNVVLFDDGILYSHNTVMELEELAFLNTWGTGGAGNFTQNTPWRLENSVLVGDFVFNETVALGDTDSYNYAGYPKIRFHPDGDYIYISDSATVNGLAIYRYSLSEAWNISTIDDSSGTRYSFNDVAPNWNFVWSFAFNGNGSAVFVGNVSGGGVSETIVKYSLSSAFDLNTRNSPVTVLDMGLQYMWDWDFSPNGDKFIVYDDDGSCAPTDTCNRLRIYDLGVDWDLTSNVSEVVGLIPISGCPANDTNRINASLIHDPSNVWSKSAIVSPDGSRLFIMDDNENLLGAPIVEYSMSPAWDPTTLTLENFDAYIPSIIDDIAVRYNFINVSVEGCQDWDMAPGYTIADREALCPHYENNTYPPTFTTGITSNPAGTMFYVSGLSDGYCSVPYNLDNPRHIWQFEVSSSTSNQSIGDTVVQPVLFGVNQLAPKGVSVCFGDPDPCYDNINEVACDAVPGCWFSEGLLGVCLGTASSCSRLSDTNSCSLVSGCEWGAPGDKYSWGGGEFAVSECVGGAAAAPTGSCGGSVTTSCTDYFLDQSGCEAVDSCVYHTSGLTSGMCLGGVDECFTYTDSSSCSSVGCEWDLGYIENACNVCNEISVSGDRLECCQNTNSVLLDNAFCGGVPTKCTDLLTENSCLAQDGCVAHNNIFSVFSYCDGAADACSEYINDEISCVAQAGCEWDESLCTADSASFIVNGNSEPRTYVGSSFDIGIDELTVVDVDASGASPVVIVSITGSSLEFVEGQTITVTLAAVDYEITLTGIFGPSVDPACATTACEMSPDYTLAGRDNAMGIATVGETSDGISFLASTWIPYYVNATSFAHRAKIDLDAGGSNNGVGSGVICFDSTCYLASVTSEISPTFYLWEIVVGPYGSTSRNKIVTTHGALDLDFSGVGDIALVQMGEGVPAAVVFMINGVDDKALVACGLDWDSDCVVKSIPVSSGHVSGTLMGEGLAVGQFDDLAGAIGYTRVYASVSDWLVDGGSTKGYSSHVFSSALEWNNANGGVKWRDSADFLISENHSSMGVAGTIAMVSAPAIGPCSNSNVEGLAFMTAFGNSSGDASASAYCYRITRDSNKYVLESQYDGVYPFNENISPSVTLVDLDGDHIVELVTQEGVFSTTMAAYDFSEFGVALNNTYYIIPADITSEGYTDFLVSTLTDFKTLLSIPSYPIGLNEPGEGTTMDSCSASFDPTSWTVQVVGNNIRGENRGNLTYEAVLYFEPSASSLGSRVDSAIGGSPELVIPAHPSVYGAHSVVYTVTDESAFNGSSSVSATCEVPGGIPELNPKAACDLGADGDFNYNDITLTAWRSVLSGSFFPSLADGIATFSGNDDIVYDLDCDNSTVWLSGRISSGSGEGEGFIYLQSYNEELQQNEVIGGLRLSGKDVYMLTREGISKIHRLSDTDDWVEFSLEFNRLDFRYTAYINEVAAGNEELFMHAVRGPVSVLGIERSFGDFLVDFVSLEGDGGASALDYSTTTNYALSVLDGCFNGTRNFENDPVGEIGRYEVVNEFCYRYASENEGYCTLEQLKQAIKFNSACYYEAHNYCQAFTYPLSNGFDDFTQFNGDVLNISTVEGTAACTTNLAAGAAFNNVLTPAINGMWAVFERNLFVSILLLALVLFIAGSVALKRKK